MEVWNDLFDARLTVAGHSIAWREVVGNAFGLMAELVKALRTEGHDIHHVDVGGGLGIPYNVDEDAPPVIHGDRSRLRQMLLHLATNAVTFTDRGGVHLFPFQQRGQEGFLMRAFAANLGHHAHQLAQNARFIRPLQF